MIVVTTLRECRLKLSSAAWEAMRKDCLQDGGGDPAALEDDTPIAINRRDLLRYGLEAEFCAVSDQVQVLGQAIQ